MSEGYDVLRLIEHNGKCYVSSEYVNGKPLIEWLKYHPNLEKEQLFTWISEMARQLECVHKCRGNPCYQYVNPYSVIISQKKELYYLDMNAESNENMRLKMTRRSVRECFLPSEASYYQSASVELDIYGLGKTIQYLISTAESIPPLSRREERKYQKIISKCLNRQSRWAYTEVSRFRKEIPIYQTAKKQGKRKILIKIFLISAMVLILGARATSEPENESEISPEDTLQEVSVSDEMTMLKRELGFCYFLELEDYEKSQKYFTEITEDKAAEGMTQLCEFMISHKASEENQLRTTLENIENYMTQDWEREYYRCLFKGYTLLDSKEDAEELLRIGHYVLKSDWAEEVEQEVTEYMAAAYEKTGELDEAIKLYTDMLEWEKEKSAQEELYKKMIALYQEKEEPELALEICRQGIKELEESCELRILHIRMQCEDSDLDREVCAQTIQQYRKEIPSLAEEEEFKKLMLEYGIVIEGENVWVGR